MKKTITKVVRYALVSLFSFLFTGSAWAAVNPTAVFSNFTGADTETGITVGGYTLKANGNTVDAHGITISTTSGVTLEPTSGNNNVTVIVRYSNLPTAIVTQPTILIANKVINGSNTKSNNTGILLTANNSNKATTYYDGNIRDEGKLTLVGTTKQPIPASSGRFVYSYNASGGTGMYFGANDGTLDGSYDNGIKWGSSPLTSISIGSYREGTKPTNAQPATGMKIEEIVVIAGSSYLNAAGMNELAAYKFPSEKANDALVAAWNGDFGTLTKGDYTLNPNNNTVASDGSSITIDQSLGVAISATGTSPFGASCSTMIIEFSDYANPSSGNQLLLASTDSNPVYHGLVAQASGNAQAYWNTGLWNNGKITDGSFVLSSSSTHTLAIAWRRSDGQGSDTDNGTKIYLDGVSKANWSTLYGQYSPDNVAIGGPISGKSIASGVTAATGMKIKKIAVFNSKLSAAEIAAYKFPVVPIKPGSIVTWSNTGSANEVTSGYVKSRFKFRIPGSEVLPAGSTVKIKSVRLASISTTGSVNNNKDPFWLRLNGVMSGAVNGIANASVNDGKSPVLSNERKIAANNSTEAYALEYEWASDCIVTVGTEYGEAGEGGVSGSNNEGLSLLHNNGNVLISSGKSAANVRFVHTADANSIFWDPVGCANSTGGASPTPAAAGYYPVCEVVYEVLTNPAYVTKATATISANTNWSREGGITWDDVAPEANSPVELTFSGSNTLTLDTAAVGKSFLIKGNSSADQTIKIAGSAANVAAFIAKATLDDTFTGKIEYEFDCTAASLTADAALKTLIKTATTNVKFVFKSSNSNGATLDFTNPNNNTTIKTHLVFDGGTHTLKHNQAQNGVFLNNGTIENPSIFVTSRATLTLQGHDLCGYGNNPYIDGGVIKVDDGATLVMARYNGTFFFRQQICLMPGATMRANGSDTIELFGGSANEANVIYVPDSVAGNTKVATISGNFQIRCGSGDPAIEIAAFVGENSILKLEKMLVQNAGSSLVKRGAGKLEFTGSGTTAAVNVQAGSLALDNAVVLPSVTLNAATTIDVPSGAATITALTGAYAITKTGAGTLNLPESYTETVTLEGGLLNSDFGGNIKITGALDLTNVTSFPIGGTVVASGNTGSIKLPASFVDGQIVKFAGETLEGSGLTILDSTGTDITANLQIVDGHIAMVAQEITATLNGSYYPDWKELPWDGERTWSDGLKAILTIANENVYITVPEAVSASIALEGEGNVSFTCAGNLVCDAIDATELDGAISFSSSNVTTIRAGDNNVDYAYTGNAHVALNIETTGAIKVENTTGAQVDINAGASDLTYKYTGNTPIAPSISTTGNFTKEGAGTITGLNFGTDYTGQVTINAGMISSDYLSFGETPHVTIAAGATWQNTHANVSLQDQARDYSNVTGSGRLEFKSLSSAANAWRAIPVSMDKMWEQSLEFVVSEKDGAILSGATVDYVMGSLSGDCKLRYDFSSGTRSLKVVQSRDTTWNGTFFSSYNERFSTFTVDGTGSDSHVLTLAGTFDNSHPLVVTTNGAVKVTGAWQGNVTVNGEFGGSGQVKSATEITFVDGATLRADWGALTLNVAPTFGGTLNVTLPENEAAAGYKILTLTNAAEKYINVAVTVEGDEKDYILEQKSDGIYLVEKGANGVVITVPENEEVTKTLATGLDYEKTGAGTLLVKGTIEGTLTISAGEAVIMPGASVGTVVTIDPGKDLYGYTVDINNCGKLAIPSGKTADQVRLFDAAGNAVTVTSLDENYVYFDWEITGGACWWDYEFNGNLNSTGTDTTALGGELTEPYFNEGNTALRIGYSTSYRGVSAYPSEFTAVLHGKMVDQEKQLEVGFGSTTGGSKISVAIACGNPANDEVLLLISEGFTVKKTVTMSVPNAYTAEHLYAFVCKIEDAKTKVIVYLDGKEWDSYTFDSEVNLGAGFQLGSCHGGVPTGYIKATTANQNAELDFLRVYKMVLSKDAMTKYAAMYPYVSQNGKAMRVFDASEGQVWVTEGDNKPWSQYVYGSDTPSAANGPLSSTMIEVSASAAAEVTMNLSEAANYESFDITGENALTFKAGATGTVKPMVVGLTSVGANTTIDYNAIGIGKVDVASGKTLTFDFTAFPFDTYFADAELEYTGAYSGEGTITATGLPTTGVRTVVFEPNEFGHYALKITVGDIPFTYTNEAWTWGEQSVGADIVTANPETAIVVASGTLEWAMDRASFTVNGGTLKPTSAPNAACAITVNAGGTLDLNGTHTGTAANTYTVTLNGGTLANSAEGLGIVKSLTLTDDSAIALTTGSIAIQSAHGGWAATTIALDTNTLTVTKTGDTASRLELVSTTVTGTGTIDVQSGTIWTQESNSFGQALVKLGANGVFAVRDGRTATVSMIEGTAGATIDNAGTISAFTLTGEVKLTGAGTFGAITLDDATIDIATKRGLTIAGEGDVKATITASELMSGSFTLFTKATDATIDPVTLVNEAGETLTPSSAGFDENGNYVVAFSVAITAQPIANTYAVRVTWGDGTQTATFVNNVAMIPAGATNVKVQFSVLDPEYTFSTGSRAYEVELGTVTSATEATIPEGVTVGPIVAMVGDYPNTKFYPSLALAIAAVEDGETISMFSSDENETTITKSVTIEVGTSGSTPNSINVNATANTGVTINFTKGGVVTGTIAVNGGTVNFQTAGDNVGGNFTGTLTYSSGTVTRNSDYEVAAPEGCFWYGTGSLLTLAYSEYHWIGASGDNWNDPTKWQEGVVPFGGAAIIDVGEATGYSIVIDQNTAAITSLTVTGAGVVFSGTGTINGPVTINTSSIAGTLKINGNTTIKANANSIDFAAALDVTGNLSFSNTFSNNLTFLTGTAINVSGNMNIVEKSNAFTYFNAGTITVAGTLSTTGPNGGYGRYFFGDGTSANNTMVITANKLNGGSTGTIYHAYDFKQGATLNIGAGGFDVWGHSSYDYCADVKLAGGKYVATATSDFKTTTKYLVEADSTIEVVENATLTVKNSGKNFGAAGKKITKTGSGLLKFEGPVLTAIDVTAGTVEMTAGDEAGVTVSNGAELRLKVSAAQWIVGYTSPATIPAGTNITFLDPDGNVISGTSGNVLPAKAVDKTWNGTTDNNWNVADNWTPSGVPGENDSVAIDSIATITVPDGGVTVGSVTFRGDGAITLTGGAINSGVIAKAGAGRAEFVGGTIGAIQHVGGTLAISGDYTLPAEIATESGVTLELDVASAKTITSVISGAGAFKKTGAGTLTMNGLSSYTGGTTVEAGGIVFGVTNGHNVGPIGAYYTNSTTDWDYNKAVVKNGAFIDVNGKQDMCYTFDLEAGAVLKNAGGAIGATSRQTRRVALLGNATVDAVNNAFGIHNGSNNGTQLALGEYTLTKIGNGAFELVNTVISGTGTIDVQAGTLWFNTSGCTMNDGTIKLGANGALQVSANATVKNFIANNAAITGNGTLTVRGLLDLSAVENKTLKAVNLTLTAGMTFKFPAGYTGEDKFTLCTGTLTPASGTLSANVDFGDKVEPVVLTIADKGITFDFAQTTWTGGASGEETAWDVAANWTRGVPKAASIVTIPADANIALTSASTASSITLQGNATLTMDGVTAANIKNIAVPADATLTINVESGKSATVGLISGAGAVAKSGAGTLELSAANTYAGGTTIKNGVVKRTNKASFGAANSTVEVKSGASLDWGDDSDTFQDCTKYNLVIAGSGFDPDHGKTAFYYSANTNNRTLGSGQRHPISLTLADDATIGGACNFGIMDQSGSTYNVVRVTLNGHTLTKVGTGTFYTSNLEFHNGTVVIEGGTLSVINNYSNDTFQSDAKLVVGENGHLEAFRNPFTVYDVEFTAAENTVAKNQANHLFVVKGTVVGSFTSAAKLEIAAGATIPVTSAITASNTLTLPTDGTINIDLGTAGSGNFRVITAPNGYEWDTTKITLVGSDTTDWNVSAEGTTLVVSKLPLDAIVDDADGYNFGEKIIEVNVTKIDSTLTGTQIKVVTTDKNGTQVGEAMLVPIDGSKGKYEVTIGGLTAGNAYNFNVTFVDSEGTQIEQSKGANLANIAVGTLIPGDEVFSADATTDPATVVGGDWGGNMTITDDGKYVIDDEIPSVFNVTADAPTGNYTVEYDISFDEGFETELDAEENAPIAGLTIGTDNETLYWYRADGKSWSKLDQTVTAGHYIIRMAFTDTTVTYSVKGDEDADFTTLTQDTTSAFDIASPTISSVSFKGASALAKFAAKTDDVIDSTIANEDITTTEGIVAALKEGTAVTLKTNVAIDTSTLNAGTEYTITAGGFDLSFVGTDTRTIAYNRTTGKLVITNVVPLNKQTTKVISDLNLNPTDATDKPFVKAVNTTNPNAVAFKLFHGTGDKEVEVAADELANAKAKFYIESSPSAAFDTVEQSPSAKVKETLEVQLPTGDSKVRYYRLKFNADLKFNAE